MNLPDIPYLPATELSALIRSKEVSPVEAVRTYLERIEALDDRLNAYLTVCGDEAMEAARESERALARGEYHGDMHGIPVAIKDQIHTRGIRTTFGSPFFRDHVPDKDATVVARLKSAGAILLGKLNMTEFGTTGTYQCFKTARNPWDLERHTGGSSTGSGAATAGFLCATSLGEDTGGSVRFPASWCGLVGLRPSWGRVSRYGLRPGVWSTDTIGPISRTVEDCAMTLRAIAGPDPEDSYAWDRPVPDYRAALDGNIKGLRVGVVPETLHSEAVVEEVRGAVLKATEVLGGMGASVEEVSIPLSAHDWTILGPLRIEAPMLYRDLLRDHLREIGPENRLAYLVNALLPARAYDKAQKLRILLRRQVLQALEKVDVLVMPTTGVAARKIEADATPTRGPYRFASWIVTGTFSLSNTPALSICCGFTAEGLPIGLQIGGRYFDEETVLRVAHAYEQSTPWRKRKPPI